MTRTLFLTALLAAPACARDWRTADRSSAKIAPAPSAEPRAVVQVYAARTVRWRGWFAVHTWIAVKEKDASSYEVLQVVGWRLRRGLNPVVDEPGEPDRLWYGERPELVCDLRGEPAETAIPKIRKAAAAYPYTDSYRAWPGPNSNTFTSFVLRSTPELRAVLPPNAIGRDWLVRGRLCGRSESGTGVQLSLLGLLGLTVGAREGLEVQFLGLCFGVDLLRPALKLPLVGRLGMRPAAP
ncbi:MAG: DUF3750 domain-containing protein [Elusimicrobia bacterium]|nr:DUF3750 domain-containing protein [Elusimicrobiota bacterium]